MILKTRKKIIHRADFNVTWKIGKKPGKSTGRIKYWVCKQFWIIWVWKQDFPILSKLSFEFCLKSMNKIV